MTAESFYLLAADMILIVHVSFVLFVVVGAMAIYAGHWLSWEWVRHYWFRVLHLAAILVVVLQSWASLICPLTTWEMELREKAGDATYEGAFIQHWLHTLLYFEAPGWVFAVIYTLTGGIIIASWFIVPPKRHN